MKPMHVVTVIAAALLLAACGGGDGDDIAADIAEPQAANEVPASAMATVTSYAEFAGSLGLSDTEAPMDISKVVPPTSETAAPITVL